MTIKIKGLKPHQLANIIYGTDDMDEEMTKGFIKEVLKGKADEMKSLYEKLDENNYKKITIQEIYGLGDVINLLESLEYIG